MPVPSILIGFGAFGLSVLRNFLASAATRGALAWDDDVVVGALNERTLKSLSLFWVPDTMDELHGRPMGALTGDDGYELMDDLFHQIEILDGTFDKIRTDLAERVAAARTRLLDAGRHGERDMPQLDVIVVAQPTSQDMVGLIRNLTEPAIANLAADPSFQTAQANSLLNFIQVFDFEDYWSPEMDEVRLALRRMIDEGNESSQEAPPVAGLTYLFDGNTPAGRRTAASRQQEIVLFLQFLLLENIRSSPDARIFFEPSRQGACVCSIGIRVVERSSESLRRLAAAAFAHGWLEHMESGESFDAGNSAFDELVAPWRTANLAAIVGESGLRAAVAAEIDSVERTLLAYAPTELDQASSLQDLAFRETEAAILRLSRRGAAQSLKLSREDIESFRERIDRAIVAALQERSPALTLRAVIDELQHLEQEFATAATAANPPAQQTTPAGSPFEEAVAMRREYALYLARQVQLASLKTRWWPRAAILFAVAFVPVLLAGLTGGPLDGAMSPWILALLASASLGVLFWQFGSMLLHPALRATAERGRDFYTDPDRGRIAERIRRAVRSAAVAGKISAYADFLAGGIKQHALSALADELRQARETLVARRNEIHWLRAQVREFLRSNQVDDREFPPSFQPNRIASNVRFSLERNEDLAQIAATLPRDPGRFREQVAIRHLFTSWSMPFCPTFLHPLQFLDELSKSFTDRSEIEEADTRRRALQIKTFLDDELRMSVCFKWLVTDGLPPVAKGMLIPTAWTRLEGVDAALRNAGFSQHAMATRNPERLYIYQYQLGIPAKLLVRPALRTFGADQ